MRPLRHAASITMRPESGPRSTAHEAGQLYPTAAGGSLPMPLDATYPGHVVPPACPAPWTPLSPSTCQHVSPQVASHYARFAGADKRHVQQQVPMQRPFLSAVPMGMYAPMPAVMMPEASPQQRSGFMSAQHSRHPGSFKGSPCVPQPLPGAVMPHSSPAVSEARSRLASQLSPCMVQPRFSPRSGDSIPAVPSQPVPPSSDYLAGAPCTVCAPRRRRLRELAVRAEHEDCLQAPTQARCLAQCPLRRRTGRARWSTSTATPAPPRPAPTRLRARVRACTP